MLLLSTVLLSLQLTTGYQPLHTQRIGNAPLTRANRSKSRRNWLGRQMTGALQVSDYDDIITFLIMKVGGSSSWEWSYRRIFSSIYWRHHRSDERHVSTGGTETKRYLYGGMSLLVKTIVLVFVMIIY
jgi:hypothetical protein